MLKVKLLEDSFEKVKPQADAFVTTFYDNLFDLYPQTKSLFADSDMEKQKGMLLNSLVLTVDNLTNPDVLTKKLQGLGARHVQYGALPEHYPLVGNALLATFEQFLGDDWTEEVKQAWVEAYGAITELMLSGADYTAEEVALESKTAAREEEGLKVSLLQSSFEKVKPQAQEFVDGFYHNLFTMYPSAQPLFEHTNMAKQKGMLLNSLVLTVDNLTNPDVLTEKLQGLGARHVQYGALPEHYPLVGNALLATFEQFLGDDWTEEVKQAWVEAYGAITELMLSGADYTAEEVALESKTAAREEEGLKVSLLQSSFEKVKPQAQEFVDGFYHNLFTMYPSAQPLFEHTNMAKQKGMLLNSLVLTVDNLTNPDVLTEKLQGLGARHVQYGALPEHYPLVGNALLATFEQFLGDDWTEEVKQAWVEAYGAITELMLSGADYTAEELALESAPSTTPESTSSSDTVKEHGEVKWEILAGIFAFGGVGVVLLLILL